jgi:class I fructose-bisphosphate aldolase
MGGTTGVPAIKTYRLNRLFSRSGRCLDVAVDHGFFNERGFLTGIEDLAASVRALVAAGPDAIQLTVGQADLLQALPGRDKPQLVLRTDVANVYGRVLPRHLFSRMIENPIEQALRLDAVIVVANLFQIPDQPEVSDQCVQNILRLKAEAERYGMPVMIEPLVFRANHEAGGYQVDGDLEKILPLVRQAVELGADVIKADPTDDIAVYGEVVRMARVPVLVRGGGKVPDDELLRRTEALMRSGAAGIVYGRNIIQHRDPGGMTRALMAIVHDGATAVAAGRHLTGAA